MPDPTYDKKAIKKNKVWYVAFVLSEIMNDEAPIGWSKYISTAEHLFASFDMKPKK